MIKLAALMNAGKLEAGMLWAVRLAVGKRRVSRQVRTGAVKYKFWLF